MSFPVAECIIKSVKEPRNLAKMASTFGTWLKDTGVGDDKKIWVAEHFSGTSSDMRRFREHHVGA